jgi:hypothetical protein
MNGNNIMMDASSMYPEMYHPVRTELKKDFSGPAPYFSRTEKPPRYHIVDFGISRRYSVDELPVQEGIIYGGDKSSPEHQGNSSMAADPFATDVYYVGNMVRTRFIAVSSKAFQLVLWIYYHADGLLGPSNFRLHEVACARHGPGGS